MPQLNAHVGPRISPRILPDAGTTRGPSTNDCQTAALDMQSSAGCHQQSSALPRTSLQSRWLPPIFENLLPFTGLHSENMRLKGLQHTARLAQTLEQGGCARHENAQAGQVHLGKVHIQLQEASQQTMPFLCTVSLRTQATGPRRSGELRICPRPGPKSWHENHGKSATVSEARCANASHGARRHHVSQTAAQRPGFVRQLPLVAAEVLCPRTAQN